MVSIEEEIEFRFKIIKRLWKEDWDVRKLQDSLKYNTSKDIFCIFMKLIDVFPDKNWDWFHLSNLAKYWRNNKIIMKLFYKYPTKNWDYYFFSSKADIDFIDKHQVLPWNYSKILDRYSDFRYEKTKFITKYKHWNWNWSELIEKRCINFNFVKKNLDIPWDWKLISKKCLVDILFFKQNIDKYDWDFNQMSIYIKWYNLKILEENMDKPWNYRNIQKNISKGEAVYHIIIFIDKYPDKDWDWYDISSYELFAEYIDKYSDHTLNWQLITKARWMSIEFVEKYIDKSLNWQYLTTKKFISIDFIKQHIDKNWDFIYLYNSEKIDLEFIYQNPDHSWPWHKISSNCKLKPKFVKQHLDKDWNFKLLIDNGILSYSDFSVDFMIKKYYEYEDQYYLYEGKEDTKLDIAKFLLSMDKESLEHILKTKSVWSEFGLSSNPNINPDVLDKFIDYVDPTLLIRNTFNAKQRLVRRRQRIVAYKILSNFLNGDLLRYLILQFI